MASSTNILFIDCEMTGLHPYLKPTELTNAQVFLPDRILEVSLLSEAITASLNAES